MPSRASLTVGDVIRLLHVPEFDLRQRERELSEGTEMAGWTADTLERIISQNPLVVIDRIDEDGMPWFNYELRRPDGSVEEHTLAIMDDESWEWGGT
jgi:hypothetical protein